MSKTENMDYLKQSPKVAARFKALKERPVKFRVEGLYKHFDTPDGKITALKDINFEVYRREFMSVIGPSGCGKSTLSRIIAGLDFPSQGRMLLEDEEVVGPCPDRGMVFQTYTLFPWLSVKKNVMFGLRMRGESDSSAEAQAREWINLVGLSRFENAYPNQLSGGMRQRVAIARALANQPSILLMDEPFGALDAQTRAQMQDYLLQIWKNVDITIIFITHDLDEAVYLSDRILVLRANPGEINEIIEVPVPRPRSPKQFMDPEFLATKERVETLIHPKNKTTDAKLPIVKMTEVGDEVE